MYELFCLIRSHTFNRLGDNAETELLQSKIVCISHDHDLNYGDERIFLDYNLFPFYCQKIIFCYLKEFISTNIYYQL